MKFEDAGDWKRIDAPPKWHVLTDKDTILELSGPQFTDEIVEKIAAAFREGAARTLLVTGIF